MQRRKQVLMNRGMAELFGLHGDEAIARFAAHDFAIPVGEADGIRHFIYDLSKRDPPPLLVESASLIFFFMLLSPPWE
jgi:hypothetical protein